MPSIEERLQHVEDRIAIQDLVSGLTLASDLDEAIDPANFYTGDAEIDYSRVHGAGRGIPVAEHRARSDSFLPGFDARQHQTTNFDIRIDGDAATSIAQVRGIHVIGDALWVAYGTYHHELVRTSAGWRIRRQRATLSYQSGSELVEEARRRVADARSSGPG